jgi:hypothetical protein
METTRQQDFMIPFVSDSLLLYKLSHGFPLSYGKSATITLKHILNNVKLFLELAPYLLQLVHAILFSLVSSQYSN